MANAIPQSGIGAGVADEKNPINVVTGKRDMQFYTVSHFELHGLSNMNGATTFCFGMFSMWAGIAIGIYTSASFSDFKSVSPEGKVLAGPGFDAASVMAVAFLIAAIVSFCLVRGAIGTIKRESRKQP